MFRKQFAEKTQKRKNEESFTLDLNSRKDEIANLQSETESIFYLFEELRDEVKILSPKFQTIEDYISKTKDEIKDSEIKLIQSNTYHKKKMILSTFIGAGLGSLFFIYNPYIAIGTTIGGGIIGVVTNYF